MSRASLPRMQSSRDSTGGRSAVATTSASGQALCRSSDGSSSERPLCERSPRIQARRWDMAFSRSTTRSDRLYETLPADGRSSRPRCASNQARPMQSRSAQQCSPPRVVEQALAVAPDQAELYIELAWNQLARGQRDEARATLRRAMTRVAANTMIYRIAQATPWQPIIRMLPEELADPARHVPLTQFGVDSADYYIARAHAHYGDPVRVKAYYDSLVTWAQPRARAATRDRGYQIVFAWALAGSGRRSEAARELERVLQQPNRHGRLRSPKRAR
jgi:tetratricopeptide (TPR) repeat protein